MTPAFAYIRSDTTETIRATFMEFFVEVLRGSHLIGAIFFVAFVGWGGKKHFLPNDDGLVIQRRTIRLSVA